MFLEKISESNLVGEITHRLNKSFANFPSFWSEAQYGYLPMDYSEPDREHIYRPAVKKGWDAREHEVQQLKLQVRGLNSLVDEMRLEGACSEIEVG